MKEMDCVEIVVEKTMYCKEGIHKGMQGWICCDQKINGRWLVNFPQYGEKPDIATLGICEEDLKQINSMDVRVNEKIRSQYGE